MTLAESQSQLNQLLSAEKRNYGAIAEAVNGILENFTPKTLYQEKSKFTENDLILSFVEAAFNPVEEKVGKYIEKKLQYIGRNSKYNRESFIPNSSNSRTVVGTLESIRRDVDKLWVAQQLSVADPTDENMLQHRLDFEQTRYVNILMASGEEFPFDSFETQIISIMTSYANWCLFGKTFTNLDSTTEFKPGLLSLYAIASAQEGVSVNDIQLDAFVSGGTHHIVYTPVSASTYEESRIEALAQLNQLIFKMRNPNCCFAYAEGLMQSANIADLVLVTNNQTYNAMVAADANYFKDLAKIFDPNNFLIIPETTWDTEALDTSSAATPIEVTSGVTISPIVAPVLALNGNLASGSTSGVTWIGGDIFIYEKSLFQRFVNSPLEREEEYFKNARTITMWVNWRPSFDLLADRAYCLYSAPVLVNQYAMPIFEVKKSA